MRNRIGVEESFITVVEDDGTPLKDGFGGNQGWLDRHICACACGIIAAVNISLYVTGQRLVTKTVYLEQCKSFCRKYPINVLLVRLKIGAIPSALGGYIRAACKSGGVKPIKTLWSWKKGADRYETMKNMLKNDLPVLWGLYAIHAKGKELSFYVYKNEEYIPTAYRVSSHYVVATALYEYRQSNGSLRRMVEVSSWGQRFYVDYEEYLIFAGSSSERGRIRERMEKRINAIGSNILELQK